MDGRTGRIYLKAWREHRGYSQDELAERADVSKGTISHIENGKRKASDDMLKKLAAALEITVGTLHDRQPSESAEIYEIADRLDAVRRSALLAAARSLAENASEHKVD